jgi:hypothetical protein
MPLFSRSESRTADKQQITARLIAVNMPMAALGDQELE